jgi:hypothetical protein
MPYKHKDIVVLLDNKSRKEWQDEIMKKLDLRPLGIDDLAGQFGFEKHSREYKDLIVLVSNLQERRGELPKIKAAFNSERRVYALYRTDQEKELIEKGVLSEEESEFRPTRIARDYGMGREKFIKFLESIER